MTDIDPEPDLREHVIRLHPHLYSAGKARLNTTNAQMAHSHAGDHRDRGSATHRHGPSHWERPDAWPAGWRDGSGVVMLEDEQGDPGYDLEVPIATWHAFSPDQLADVITGVTRSDAEFGLDIARRLVLGQLPVEFATERRDLSGALVGGALWRAERAGVSSFKLHLLQSEPGGVA